MQSMQELVLTGSAEFVSIPGNRNRLIMVDWEARKLLIVKIERANPFYMRDVIRKEELRRHNGQGSYEPAHP